MSIDFVSREVRPYAGEKVRYAFTTRRVYLEQLVYDHEIDWSNSLFLSCRFSARRIGPYNEFIYAFFKCLSEERLQYAEGWYVEQDATEATESIELDGWELQKRCPHLKADLSRFGAHRRRCAHLPDARLALASFRRQMPLRLSATTSAARQPASPCRSHNQHAYRRQATESAYNE